MAKRSRSPPPRTVSQRIDEYVATLPELEASLLTTALNEPFPLVDTISEELEEGNGEDESALEIDAAAFMEFPLDDDEFAVSAEDFAPLLALMKQVMAESKRLAGVFTGRIVDDGALGRFVDMPLPKK